MQTCRNDEIDVVMQTMRALCSLAQAQRRLLEISDPSSDAACEQRVELETAQCFVIAALEAGSSAMPADLLEALRALAEAAPRLAVPANVCDGKTLPCNSTPALVASGLNVSTESLSSSSKSKAGFDSWDLTAESPERLVGSGTKRIVRGRPRRLSVEFVSASAGTPSFPSVPTTTCSGATPSSRIGLKIKQSAGPVLVDAVLSSTSRQRLPQGLSDARLVGNRECIPEAQVSHAAMLTGSQRSRTPASSSLLPVADVKLGIPGEELERFITEFVADILANRGASRTLPLPAELRHWSADPPGRFPWLPELTACLRQRFGHSTFRGFQLPVINALLSSRDVFAVMPTGAGKSLCYQLPAVFRQGTAIVISPLLSLMHDQVQALLAKGVCAARLGSDGSRSDEAQVFQDLATGRLQLLYVSPERIVNASENRQRLHGALRERHAAKLLSFIVIDEAHCVSQWGLDFRKHYRELSCLRRDFPGVPILALTASATPKVENDVVQSLFMRDAVRFHDTFDRSNLFMEVREKTSDDDVLKGILELARAGGQIRKLCGIVYALSRQDTMKLAAELRKKGLAARPYHAGLSVEKKQEAHNAWMRDECQIIVATVAFAMGIDKRDVRFVCHASMPSSIERYHQEIGRAGRDGGPCRCILWHSQADMRRLRKMASNKSEMDKVNEACNLFLDESRCRRAALLAHFQQRDLLPSCNACDVCARRRLGRVRVVEEKDFSDPARTLLELATALQHHNLTAAKLREAAKGRKVDGNGAAQELALAAAAHAAYGALRQVAPEIIDKLIQRLGELRVLKEQKQRIRGRFKGFVTLLRVGPRAGELGCGMLQVTLPVPRDARPEEVVAATASAGAIDFGADAQHSESVLERPRPNLQPSEPVRKRPRRSPPSSSNDITPRAKQEKHSLICISELGGQPRACDGGSDLEIQAARIVADDSGDELVTVGGGGLVPTYRLPVSTPSGVSVSAPRVVRVRSSATDERGDYCVGSPCSQSLSADKSLLAENDRCKGLSASQQMLQGVASQSQQWRQVAERLRREVLAPVPVAPEVAMAVPAPSRAALRNQMRVLAASGVCGGM